MQKLIYLSPSDQVANKYAYGNTNEATECRKISDSCEVALKRSNFRVINNKTSNMYDRVKESNTKKADMHVCIHTNAHNGKVSGTRMFAWDLKGEGYDMAKAIYNVLAPLTPGKSESIKVATYYEIKHTNAPCVYIEVDFHDVPEVAKWITEHTKEIGEAIAKGICNYYDVAFDEPVEPEEEEQKKVVAEDGLWGQGTTRNTQRILGCAVVDGVVSNQLNKCKKYLPNMLATSWEFMNIPRGGSVTVIKIQMLVGANPDGYMGIDTVMKLQVFLQKLGLYNGKIDGIAGKQTVIGWQKYINLH